MVVGGVIFLIITIVQFLVITKGSERIAEVAARFALDAMPGKQMTIDADFNAGLISPDEAVRKREDLQRESSLYGSMDGAMKFSKRGYHRRYYHSNHQHYWWFSHWYASARPAPR